MPSPLLDSHVPHFEERSNYHFIILGIVSVARRIEQLSANTARRPSVRVVAERGGDGFLHFALGIVAVSQCFLHAAHAARKPLVREDAAPPIARDVALRNLAL